MNLSPAIRRIGAQKCSRSLSYQTGELHLPNIFNKNLNNLNNESTTSVYNIAIALISKRLYFSKKEINNSMISHEGFSSNIFRRAIFNVIQNLSSVTSSPATTTMEAVEGSGFLNESTWLSSTVKKRRMKMNKHKLKKRKKDLRMNTKVSRQ
jgi:hypothetical protein